MASGPLIPFSDGKVVEDSRAEDEEEMRRLRAAAGAASRTARRHAYLEAAAAGAAKEDPELRAELDAAAVPAPTAGRLLVADDDLLETEGNPWSHSAPPRPTQEETKAQPGP